MQLVAWHAQDPAGTSGTHSPKLMRKLGDDGVEAPRNRNLSISLMAAVQAKIMKAKMLEHLQQSR